MKQLRNILSILLFVAVQFAQAQKPSVAVLAPHGNSRLDYGLAQLKAQLKHCGYVLQNPSGKAAAKITIRLQPWQQWQKIALQKNYKQPSKEGYIIDGSRQDYVLSYSDASGALYACLELSERLSKSGMLPKEIHFADAPQMVLRGTCIGLQKSTYLPGRNVYEYPYTQESFPWFYDKKLWIQYLDSMVQHRMNSLYLWNGHPFASLVRLKDYPYAVEVDSATFKKNEEIYRFLTTEADRRGIWVIQMFYNIIVSKPFAEKHGLKTQDRERPIIPLIADYTRKSIATFVQKYPNVGLMVCLGEAMEGTGNDDIEWFTKTIIPGVKDGLKALGKKEEPPIVLRAHDTDAPAVMAAALPIYQNLYTEAKFNGEALTTAEPRGSWAALHQQLSHLGSIQIENVHIMANLEPFRYGATDFIRQCVQGMQKIMGGRGLHLYPQASYWDWPYSADSVQGKKLLQVERDWIWYAAWSRYAWNADREPVAEQQYWAGQLATHYGTTPAAATNILKAYEASGQIAPKLLRRFGITDGNRQTLTLGMLMTQLINPDRYGLFTLLYAGESPEGEMLNEYAEKEWRGLPHKGETPAQVIADVRRHGNEAVTAIDAAEGNISRDKEEFERLRNDMHCYQALANHFAYKAEAALSVLRHRYSKDIADLEKALSLLQLSMQSYKELVRLTQSSYRYANSMQTQQRKIPMRGVNGTFKTWAEVAVPFQAELDHFAHNIDSLKHAPQKEALSAAPWSKANVTVVGFSQYRLDTGLHSLADTSIQVVALAPELAGLDAISIPFKEQQQKGTTLHFRNDKPVKILVGYFNAKDHAFAQAPQLETNAGANDHGEAEAIITRAMVIKGMPAVNVHSYYFKEGNNILQLPKGACLVLGFTNENNLHVYDAGLTEAGVKSNLDWLFE